MIAVLGNPDLTTVKADHYVWGVNQTLGRGWRWGADLYSKDLTDVVISAEQDATADDYSNGAEGSAYGVELLVRKDKTDRWYGWASLSLAESDRTRTATGETVKFEYDKPVLLNLVANRQIGKYWSMGFRWTYQSGGRYTPIVDLVPSSTHANVMEPVYGDLNSQQYPDFHRADFRAEYTRPPPARARPSPRGRRSSWPRIRSTSSSVRCGRTRGIRTSSRGPGRWPCWPPSAASWGTKRFRCR